MNPRIWRYAIGLVAWVIFVLLSLSGWKNYGLSQVLEPVLLTMLMVTLIRGWLTGLAMALVAGWLYQQFSPWPALANLGAMLVAITVVALSLRWWLTSRSGASFLFLIPLGTLTYYLALAGLIAVSQVFFETALGPDWRIWFQVAAIQAGVHSLLSLLVLRFRKSRYSTAQLEHQF